MVVLNTSEVVKLLKFEKKQIVVEVLELGLAAYTLHLKEPKNKIR